MNLQLTRTTRTENSTIGDLSIDGNFFCNTLEPTDRGLTSTMPFEEIIQKKVHGKTAIPTGTYDIVMTFSHRWQKKVPLLQNVPDFIGVEMHIGNKPADTEGCLLCGEKTSVADFIEFSTATIEKLYPLFEAAELRGEKSTITIS